MRIVYVLVQICQAAIKLAVYKTSRLKRGRCCVSKADSKRDILFLYISLTLGGEGVVAFLTDGKHSDEHYAIIHSIWHTCAYVAMYFGLRSIRRSDITDMRVPRVVFNNRITLGKIAYH